MHKKENKIHTYGLAAAISPYLRFNSSSRAQMVASHLSQTIPPHQSDLPRSCTGFESQLADFTFDIKMPSIGKAVIYSIHRKFIPGVGMHSIPFNPLTSVIFQDQATSIYDVVDIEEFYSNHGAFGLRFKLNPIVKTIRPGVTINPGTILAISPNIHKNSAYSTGLDVQVAYMSLPSTIEDGFRVSESFCERAKPLKMGTSIVEWGKKTYPLNIYGDGTQYKPHPDIGDTIRDDGLVFATREYDPVFDPIDMTRARLTKVDMVHDLRSYGVAGAVVHDVKVESGIGENKSKTMTPSGMELQGERYVESLREYYSGIRKAYDLLVKKNKKVVIGPKLQVLVTRAIADKPNDPTVKRGNTGIIRRGYKKVTLNEYRVEVHYSKKLTLGKGAKISNLHGGSVRS